MKKDFGQVFTPHWVVDNMLNLIAYMDEQILDKYIMEPSCGDGAFLKEIVRRYIEAGIKYNRTISDIKQGLETYIYAIELDSEAFNECINNLNQISNEFNIYNVNWNIHNQDALPLLKHNLQMDYIVGNPPYIRIHNIKPEIRDYLRSNYQLCKKGMIDLYLAFFELGIKSLKPNGKLCYITPNTFLNNTSSKAFRNMVEENNYLKQIINFGTHQIFNASTYTAITVLEKGKSDSYFDYYTYKDLNILFVDKLNLKDYKDHKWNFTTKENLSFIFDEKNQNQLNLDINVQYGFATLRDKIYISGDIVEIDEKYCLFNGFKIEKQILYSIVKGSKYNEKEIKLKIIYPYRYSEGKWIPFLENELKEFYPYAYEYFLHHKEELLKRNMDNNFQSWFQFGRSQGIQNCHQDKLIVDMFVKSNCNIKAYSVPSNVFVYSGIFIFGNDLNKIKSLLESDEFYKYIQIVGKDMRNNYKTLTTSHIRHFLKQNFNNTDINKN